MTGIETSQKTASIKVGDTRNITVSAVPSDADNSNDVVSAVTWSSSDDTKATVSATGVITGVAEGTATITATSGSFTATVAVTVTAA